MSSGTQQDKITLGETQEELLGSINRENINSKIVSGLTTTLIVGMAGLSAYSVSQGHAGAFEAFTKTWLVGMFCSLLVPEYANSDHAYITRTNDAVKAQRKKYHKASHALISKEQDSFINTLHQREGKAQKLNDEDFAIMATIPEEKLKNVPTWVPMNSLSMIFNHRENMESIDTYLDTKFNQCAKQTKIPPTKNNLLWIATGLLPLKLFFTPNAKKPDSNLFDVPYPEKPDLKQLAVELKKMKQSGTAPSV